MSEIQTETARHNMVISQLRTFEVLDDRLLELMERAPRQEFVPPAYRNLAFADMQIPLGNGEVMMAPLVEARLVQTLDIKPSDRILEIGTGTGFVTWLLAQLGSKVYSVESNPEFATRAAQKLAALGVRNAEIETGDAARGWDRHAPYDAIFVGGSLPILTESLRKNLAVGGRMVAVVGQGPAMEARLITRVSEGAFQETGLFDTVLPALHGAPAPEKFVF